MNEVEAEADTTDADAEQRRIVAQCMPHVPDNMNIKEGYILMNMLYQVGILSDYLADLDNIDYENVEFKDYFDFNKESDIMIDPETGKITFLRLEMKNDVANNDRVPSIIDQFQSLERLFLMNCGLLTMELGNLPLLKRICFYECTSTMFENVPEGLQLSSIKEVIIHSASSTTFESNLSSFLKIFSNTLEELKFYHMTPEDSDEILHVLQNDDLCFRHSLTTIEMRWCQLTEDNLKLMLFEILGRFPNLHTLDITGNNIESLIVIGDGIKHRIKHGPLIPDNKLRKLNLSKNPIMLQICGDGVFFDFGVVDDDDDDAELDDESEDGGGETDALVTLLDTFNGISNVCANASSYQEYKPKIEYKLRINLAGRKELMDRPTMNRALWPLILERAYSNSSEIYMYVRNGRDTVTINQEVESKKCASGLFYLLKE
ncbi:hypothetical protein FRACYDRAFT_247410 [Fragilariopsis cylindrus CCMP1102]|uniref:RNI-like protein n=1 Tax=Fragilariopsis cylindrus CCMP1102 TaxID=635003 RepID=A0A1E7EWZ3_9STRA|nr:hypothetical protein FRACYDRAFT_247410 [Fragilariopsis cylindrus CCMP1102]|eukprot:OEU10376.1 hypothetical protein FRACYDRAFT_247410 [Fragilariopsis cylindrus CCMP1102]